MDYEVIISLIEEIGKYWMKSKVKVFPRWRDEREITFNSQHQQNNNFPR